MNIRKAEPNDIEEIRQLNHRLFLHDLPYDPRLNIGWPLEDFGEVYFKKRISGETGVCFVAEEGGRLVGYATGHVESEIDSTDTILRCELDNIYVEDAYRRSGVGRHLVSELDNWCKERGAKNMLVIAYAGNLDAIQFYESYGFKPFALKLERDL